ncbi:MAG: C40 family peptidase [Myxococcales bacterium]|nr:C40 family peptidase [Myxococcales bacterium]
MRSPLPARSSLSSLAPPSSLSFAWSLSSRWSVRALLLSAGLALAGCAHAPVHPHSANPAGSLLVARAWAGREPPTTPRAWAAVEFASAQVGKRYCWGGIGLTCFDCSGLVQRAWSSVGVRIPRTADAIADSLAEIRLEEVRAGDILWWPGHVGMYVGNGWMVEALDRRHGVVRRPAVEPERALRPTIEEGAL